MKNRFFFTCLMLIASVSYTQRNAYKAGEYIKYALSYSGFLKAGEATLRLTEEEVDGVSLFHAKGVGKTSSLVRWFFKVDDRYESYFEKGEVKPYKFIRDVDEGGHLIRRDIIFKDDKAYIQDFVKEKKSVKSAIDVQDMISAFYNLRNHDTSNLNVGDEIAMGIFFDGLRFPFKMKYLGEDEIDTDVGRLKTQIFRPLVKSGRVFKEKESVRIWVTNDENKIPVFIKADLRVGSVRASVLEYSGLKYNLNTVK